jgi:hypothetical protein
MSRRRQKKPRGQRADKVKSKSGFPLADQVSDPRATTETSSQALAGAGWPIAPPSAGRPTRQPITIALASSLYARAKNVVKLTPDLTLGGLVVEALQTHLDKLERRLKGTDGSDESEE